MTKVEGGDATGSLEARRGELRMATRMDEAAAVGGLLDRLSFDRPTLARVHARAADLVRGMRATGTGLGNRLSDKIGGLDDFLNEFGLSTAEGVALMCLAEALLRVPDAETADRLIRDKIGDAEWDRHLGRSAALFVNASTWALMLTGRVIGADLPGRDGEVAPSGILRRLIGRVGEPVIRRAMVQAMRLLGRQFVLGQTIGEALDRARASEKRGYRHSYDMLGEAARTAADAKRYFASYKAAIAAIGASVDGRPVEAAPGISIKLSALHPRFEAAQADRVRAELTPALIELGLAAKAVGLGLTVDAEEADRLDLSLDVIEAAATDPRLAGWNGFGLAVQAYQKRAIHVIGWLEALAEKRGTRLMVRLVKGAYWDSEIKRGQERGLDGFPVFTRKASTDVSYIACAQRLLARRDLFYPQFATHNAHTVAIVTEMAGNRGGYEFQRLHGMGDSLYDQIVAPGPDGTACRTYAPVGGHEDLLAYLVRRLLENGANTSFINRISDAAASIDDVVADPIARVAAHAVKPHPRISLPDVLYQPSRVNSRGVDFGDPLAVASLMAEIKAGAGIWRAAPSGVAGDKAEPAHSPTDRRRVVGEVVNADPATVERALATAAAAKRGWSREPAEARAACLDRAADLIQAERGRFLAMLIAEGGKTIPDAIAELRETIDFLRYYAAEARRLFARPIELPGPTGERNTLALAGRGVFVCIAPWNFPLAIFTGQIAAALAAGNPVLAKPAEQTPLIAAAAVDALRRAGVPAEVLRLLPGDGETVGAALVGDPRVSGVAFTGSTATARAINLALARRPGPLARLIAETGGQNAMIVDSTALPEQVVDDVLTSAFRSAGQRCSALRVLFLQEDVADKVIEMLAGAARELVVGDPAELRVDVGPVIDEQARGALERHAAYLTGFGRSLVELPVPKGLEFGTFFGPRAIEIDRLDRLPDEVFGPILHVIRYAADRLPSVLEAVEATGYGLTLGVHTRIDSTATQVTDRLEVGNAYVNRSMIGATVGTQPFGGEGLSGTGPKAGGPHYLLGFAIERVLSVNTTAAGGNTTLVSMGED